MLWIIISNHVASESVGLTTKVTTATWMMNSYDALTLK